MVAVHISRLLRTLVWQHANPGALENMESWGISLHVSFYMRPQGAALLTFRLKAHRVHVSGETGGSYWSF